MWFLISYNRPDKCKAVIEQINLTNPTAPGILFVNGYEQLDQYLDIPLPKNWRIYPQITNLGVCGAMNKCFYSFPNESYYGFICDDEYVFTEKWDTLIPAAAGDWKIAHGNDGWQSHRRIHGYVVCGGELVRKCGWWALPGLWHWFVDDVFEYLAENCNLRVFCKDIKIEHRHPLTGKAKLDSTYASGSSRTNEDFLIFEKWKKDEASALIAKINKKLNKDPATYSWV